MKPPKKVPHAQYNIERDKNYITYLVYNYNYALYCCSCRYVHIKSVVTYIYPIHCNYITRSPANFKTIGKVVNNLHLRVPLMVQ